MATRTISALGGNWNALATWDEGVVPTAADDVVARGDGTSGNLVMNVTGLVCRSINFTNYVGTWSWSNSVTLSVGTSSLGPGGISFKVVAGMTISVGTGDSISFVSTVTGNIITALPGTFTLPAANFNGTGGGYTVDGWKSSTTVTVTRGAVDFTNATITTGAINSNFATTRSINLTNAILNLSTTGSLITLASTALTFTATGSTLNVTDTSGNTKTIATGGVSCAGMTVNYTGSGAGALAVTGTAPAFAAFNVAGHKLTIPAGTTTTLTSSLRLRGPNGSLVSSTGGTAATLSAGGGVTVDVEAVSIQDITGSGGATFAAVNSTNVSGNTGWTFRRLARGWGVSV